MSKKPKRSEWSPEASSSEDSEAEQEYRKKSYEPSKNASDPTIKTKGFKKKGADSTKARKTPARHMDVEEISYEKLMELGHTDEITDRLQGLKKRKTKKKKRERSEEQPVEPTKPSSRPYTPTIQDPFQSPEPKGLISQNSPYLNPYASLSTPNLISGSQTVNPYNLPTGASR